MIAHFIGAGKHDRANNAAEHTLLVIFCQNFGACNSGCIKEVANKLLLFCVAFMSTFAVILIAGLGTFVRVFSKAGKVICIGRSMLLIHGPIWAHSLLVQIL